MNMKRLLCLLLAACMVIPFAACGTGEDDVTGSDTGTSAAATEVSTEDMSFRDELPALDFGNAELTALTTTKIGVGDELACEKTNGELINDAVYTRNCTIEDRLHVKLNVVAENAAGINGSVDYYVGDTIHKLVTTGDNEYQFFAIPSYVGMQNAIKGDYRDLFTLGHLDLDKSYWAQGYNDMASWGGDHQFLASGSAALTLFRYMYVTLYSKDLMKEQQIEDPFEKTLNGEWTLDYQYEITSGVYKDLNGDGKEDEKDFYGFITGNHTSGDCYWIGGDAHVLQKDDDDLFYYDPDVDRLVNVMEAVQKLYYKPGSYIYHGAVDVTDSTLIIDAFDEGRAMMVTVMIGKLETNLRDYAGDYGILPMPKYDSVQKDYRTCVQDQVSGFGVPVTVPDDDLDMLGAVLECLASESYKTVVDAYYNTALSYKYLNNAESLTMLDLTYNSVAFEIAQIYTACLGSTNLNFLEIMRSILQSKKNTVASQYKKISRSMGKAVENLNSSYDKVVSMQ